MTRVRRRAAFRSTWTWPIALGVLTTIGLVAALVGDGVWDAVSWAGLAAPLVVAWIASRPKRTARDARR